MRLICSPSLDEADQETIRRLGVHDDAIDASLTSDIEQALQDSDQVPVVEFLATL